jgi:hypothetical protein
MTSTSTWAITTTIITDTITIAGITAGAMATRAPGMCAAW